MTTNIYVIIVTHNSMAFLETCLSHLDKQTIPAQEVIVVDSGSSDTTYLQSLSNRSMCRLVTTDNIGFGRANNLGMQLLHGVEEGMVVFLNPDTFLPPDFLGQAVEVLNENPRAGAISGKLLGFDVTSMKATGQIDSAGIYRHWYGRWYDRGQGRQDEGQYDLIASPLALCGALLCCRLKALAPFGETVFDADFFLYKEDIDLCLRLRKSGWTLVYDPRLVAYHCRGWSQRRHSVAFALRLAAARSEVLLCQKHPGPQLFWAWSKFLAVRFLRL
jgi:N-acetylglucosaminyl-diphospho-decaprenol L-rhamnosyltransferase